MFSSVLVLCVGNVCRSPMAVAMLHERLQATQVRIQSAGIAALSGSSIDPTAHAVLQSHRVQPRRHAARQMSRELLRQADLILLMEQAHFSDVLELAPEVRGKAFLMGKWQDPSTSPTLTGAPHQPSSRPTRSSRAASTTGFPIFSQEQQDK